MTPFEVGLIGIGILLIILFSGMQIGFGMGFVGFWASLFWLGLGPLSAFSRQSPIVPFLLTT